MWRLALRTLRFRKGAFLATFIALFLGGAIVSACGGLLETGIRSNVPPQRLDRAAVVVIGDRGYELAPGSEDNETAVLAERVPVDAGLARRLDGLRGVAGVVADRTVAATVLGGGGKGTELEAHGWSSARLAPYRLAAGSAPAGPRQVVLDAATARAAGAEPGEMIRIAAHGEAGRYRVAGIARPRTPVDQPGLFFSDAEAARLSGGGATRAGALAVIAEPGADHGELKAAVAAALSGAKVKVLGGDDRGFAEFPQAESGRTDLIALAGVFGGMAVMTALFVTSGAMALSAAQRHRELALLRASGATPRQLRRMLLAEALLIALLAALPAWPLGKWLGGALFERISGAGVTAEQVEFSSGWIPLAAAGGALLLTALAAGLIGARRAVRVRAAQALAESNLQTRWFSWVRLMFAVLFLGGAAALATVTVLVLEGPIAASTAGPTVICASVGLALLAPGLTKVCAALLDGPVRALTGASGRLAMLNTRARVVRTAAAVVPIMLATGVATGNLYLQTTQTAAVEEAFTANLRADAVIGSASGTVRPELAGQVAELPGVAAAGAYVSSIGYLERPGGGAETGEDGLALQGVSASAVTQTTAVGPSSGSFGELHGRTLALPASAGHEVGDTVRMRFGDGASARLKVVAVYRPAAKAEVALLPAALLAAHTDGGLPQQILVRAQPGTDGAELTAVLERFAEQRPGLSVADREQLLAAHAEGTATQAWVNYLLVAMLVVYTAISVVNNLVSDTGRRRREFGLQRLSGATRRQVLRMMAVEGTVVAAIGILLGTICAATTVLPFAYAATGGWTPSGPVWIYLVVVASALLLALTATLLPTWRVLRVRPAEAARAGDE
jgi:putative ABC transport system permease protein